MRENVSLLALERRGARGRRPARAASAELVAGQIEQLDVRTPSMETTVASLSGGNQQKVLFARSLLAEPTVLLADEPTRGVDAGARLELYQVMRGAAEAGQAVVVLSSDAVELQGLCDRVLVFSRGQVVRDARGRRRSPRRTSRVPRSRRDTERSGVEASRRERACSARRFGAGDYLPTRRAPAADRGPRRSGHPVATGSS